MKKFHLVIDVALCENCNNCFLACKDEFCGNDWPGYSAAQPIHGQRWMDLRTRERGRFPVIDVAYLPVPCQHCDDAPCVRAARHQAVFKRPDGIVIIDPEKSKGQRQIVQSCPFGAIGWDEAAERPQKCTLCAHLLDADNGQVPRCVQACPTGALSLVHVDDDQWQSMMTEQDLQPLSTAGNIKPQMGYRNLYRYDACFVAGSVATGQATVAECVVDAAVQLFDDGRVLAETKTDAFGDFKFDGLADHSGPYFIEIHHQAAVVRREVARLDGSCSLDTIWLD
ncbi:MAG: hypothetical protein JJV98_12395 [Desulfosarcina sp.]|nr:hypothetical protein [Desulfobacterales bacterium]